MNGLALVVGAWLAAAALPQEKPPPRAEERRVEIYDVNDLALPARLRGLAAGDSERGGDLTMPEVARVHDAAIRAWLDRKRQAGVNDRPSEGISSDESALKLVETMTRCIAANVDPDAQCDLQKSGALVVRATAAMHAQVARVLRMLRQGAGVVTVRIRLLDLDDAARRLLMELEKIDSAKAEQQLPQVVTVLPTTIDRLLASDGCNLLDAPSVTTLPLDAFELDTGDEVSCVTDYDAVAIEGMGRVAVPIVKKIHCGTRIEGRAVVASGLETTEPPPFALRIEITDSVLKRPIETAKSDLGVFQLPRVAMTTITSTVAANAGATVLIGGIPKQSFEANGPSRYLYALVTVGASAPPAEGAPEAPPGKTK